MKKGRAGMTVKLNLEYYPRTNAEQRAVSSFLVTFTAGKVQGICSAHCLNRDQDTVQEILHEEQGFGDTNIMPNKRTQSYKEAPCHI